MFEKWKREKTRLVKIPKHQEGLAETRKSITLALKGKEQDSYKCETACGQACLGLTDQRYMTRCHVIRSQKHGSAVNSVML